MTDSSQAIAAGWYADPSDPANWRWWDGVAWTDHTAPGAHQEQQYQQPAQQHYVQPEQQQPAYQQHVYQQTGEEALYQGGLQNHGDADGEELPQALSLSEQLKQQKQSKLTSALIITSSQAEARGYNPSTGRKLFPLIMLILVAGGAAYLKYEYLPKHKDLSVKKSFTGETGSNVPSIIDGATANGATKAQKIAQQQNKQIQSYDSVDGSE